MDGDTFWAGLDQMGEDVVRLNLARGVWAETRKRMAEAWLEQKTARDSASDRAAMLAEAQRTNEIAQSANALATAANSIAESALTAAQTSASAASASSATAKWALGVAALAILVAIAGLFVK